MKNLLKYGLTFVAGGFGGIVLVSIALANKSINHDDGDIIYDDDVLQVITATKKRDNNSVGIAVINYKE